MEFLKNGTGFARNKLAGKTLEGLEHME